MKGTLLTAVLLLAGAASMAQARVFFGFGIGYPVVAAPPVMAYAPPSAVAYAPGPNYAWIGGSYYPVGPRWVWRPGYWAPRPYAGAVWVAPRYAGGRWFAGHWRR